MTKRRGATWALVPGIAGLALALLYLWQAGRYPVGSLASPGPGFFPVAVGIITVLVAGCAIVTEYLKASIHPQMPGAGFWRVPAMALAGIAFIYLLDTVGYVIAMTALCAGALSILARRRWWVVATLSAGTGLTIYLLFINLGVPLPAGVLPF